MNINPGLLAALEYYSKPPWITKDEYVFIYTTDKGIQEAWPLGKVCDIMYELLINEEWNTLKLLKIKEHLPKDFFESIVGKIE